jgi:hypothetical protein
LWPDRWIWIRSKVHGSGNTARDPQKMKEICYHFITTFPNNRCQGPWNRKRWNNTLRGITVEVLTKAPVFTVSLSGHYCLSQGYQPQTQKNPLKFQLFFLLKICRFFLEASPLKFPLTNAISKILFGSTHATYRSHQYFWITYRYIVYLINFTWNFT